MKRLITHQPDVRFPWRLRGLTLALAMLASAGWIAPGKAQQPTERCGAHGFVYSSAGQKITPINGATIEFTDQSGKLVASVKSGSSGYYAAGLKPGTYFYKVRASGFKDEHQGRGITLRRSEGYEVYSFTLAPGRNDPDAKPPTQPAAVKVAELRGQVYEKTDKGEMKSIISAVVTLRPTAGTGKAVQVLTSPAADSSANLSGYKVILEAGTWQVSVSAPGFDPLPTPATVVLPADKMSIQDFVLTRPVQVAQKQGIKGIIRVAGSGSTQLPPDLKVVIRPLGNASRTPKLDTAGRFLEELPPGRYQVTAEAAGFTPAIALVEVSPRLWSQAALTLRAAKSDLVVLIYDAATTKPLEKATVRLRSKESSITQAIQLVTGKDGRVAHIVKSAGTWQVVVQMNGYRPAGQEAQTVPGKTTTVKIYLSRDQEIAKLPKEKQMQTKEPIPSKDTIPNQERDVKPVLPTTVSVLVVDARTGSPLRRASVRILQAQDGKVVAQGFADEQGLFQAKAIPGTMVLDVKHPSYREHRSTAVLVPGSNQRRVGLIGQPSTHTIQVLVREAGKANTFPVADAQVRILDVGNKVVATGPSDKLGRFTAKNLSAGVYVIFADKAGYTQTNSPKANLALGDQQPEVLLATRSSTSPNKPLPQPDMVTVPNVLEKPYSYAVTALKRAQLRVTGTAQTSTAIVVSQTPAPGTRVARGSNVSLQVRQPQSQPSPKPPMVIVPDVREKSYGYAATVLQRAQLKVFGAGQASNAVVVSQTPAPGTRVAQGTSVTLQVRQPQPQPPKMATVPDVRKRTYADAVAMLQAAGLRVVGAADRNATVISQSIAPGTRVAIGANVALTVQRSGPNVIIR